MTRAAFVAAGALCALVGFGSRAHSEAGGSAQRLAWLAGCWAYANPGAEPGSGETWMPPAGRELLGVARTVRGGRVVSYEFQRIVEGERGDLSFVAALSGQPEVRFPLKSLKATEVVFENLENDFPQRVIYRLAQKGNISARIEGATDDPGRAIDLPMRRTSCERTRRR